MWVDDTLEFADATALDTTGTNTDNIGDLIDLGAAGEDIGNGEPLYLVVQVTTAVTSGGSATVSFQLASDSTTTVAVDGNQSIHVVSDAYPVASLVAGFEVVLPVPPGGGGAAFERYLAFQTTTGTAALTAGNVNAFLTREPAVWKAYADANN